MTVSCLVCICCVIFSFLTTSQEWARMSPQNRDGARGGLGFELPHLPVAPLTTHSIRICTKPIRNLE